MWLLWVQRDSVTATSVDKIIQRVELLTTSLRIAVEQTYITDISLFAGARQISRMFHCLKLFGSQMSGIFHCLNIGQPDIKDISLKPLVR
jgi:hypothetical protein